MVCTTVCFLLLISHTATPQSRAQGTSESRPFTFAEVRRQAIDLANKPFEDRRDTLPQALQNLTYDAYRDILFRPEKALWRDEGLPFTVHFFHRASYLTMILDKVTVNIVHQGQVVPVPYTMEWFDFGRNVFPPLPADLGFAGFRLHYPLHREDYSDEIVVFLGASFFRALGQHQHYGLSARGLAIDTGLSTAEEFPRFHTFWLEKPDGQATAITLYALMESKSAAGAYQFIIHPGKTTVLEVQAHVIMRHPVEKIGFAPLTSMFFSGEGTERALDDFRPEVHDSDGLLMATGHGEWIWRPLINPTHVRVSSFRDTNPRGFGLLQRDRNFDHYQDLEAFYEKRPSIWIEPVGDWGKGAVQLVEIPSDADWYDNIVVFWHPDEQGRAGKEWQFEYRLSVFLDQQGLPPGGRVNATRIGRGGPDGVVEPYTRKFVLDFVGDQLRDLPSETPLEAVVTASSGTIANKAVQRNTRIDGWRVFFELRPESTSPVELRCFLKLGEDTLTETWSYQWHPP